MPKILNYPLASFEKSLEVAEATDSLGGTCNVETCAQKLDKKVSGAFMVIISSAQKFGLIENEKGNISVTENFKLIKHAYTNEESNSLLTKAFLTPPVFSALFERFKLRELPIKLLDKILIREFGVEENVAGRVSGYFIDGLDQLGLLDSNNHIRPRTIDQPHIENKPAPVPDDLQLSANKSTVIQANSNNETLLTNGFIVHIYGPGLNNKITIEEEEDLLIVEATLKKIKKALKGAEK